MTKIKLCGLTTERDIEIANSLKPEFVGFVFAEGSRRGISYETADNLRAKLNRNILSAGVFVDEPIENILELFRRGTIDIAQLHGDENEEYIKRLRDISGKPVIKAFRITDTCDYEAVERCGADFALLDSGAGSGKVFDWNLVKNIKRPYFLAGGLSALNVREAIKELHPYAVDVSSKIEKAGVKDEALAREFVRSARS